MRFRFTYEVQIIDRKSSLFGKKYYGKHTTKKLNDDYVGSSQVIRDYVRKHGRDGIKRRILCMFQDDESLNKAAKELIKSKMSELGDDCLNLRCSSVGGFDAVNEAWRKKSPIERSKCARNAGLAKKNCPIEVRQSWSRHYRAAHAQMSKEEKAKRYGRVSASLARYYSTPKGRAEIAARLPSNIESNRIISRQWRTEFRMLFGTTPESFRKFGKMKAALDLFRVAKKNKENYKDEINRFVASTR